MVRAVKIWFEENMIFVKLNDDRIVGTPISWYPNLSKGTPSELLEYELWENGRWIHWEKLNEDISAEGLLSFKPAKV